LGDLPIILLLIHRRITAYLKEGFFKNFLKQLLCLIKMVAYQLVYNLIEFVGKYSKIFILVGVIDDPFDFVNEIRHLCVDVVGYFPYLLWGNYPKYELPNRGYAS
jgi:hypothetical protein